MRKFEFVEKYKDAGLAKPSRATHKSAGYDLTAAESVVVPSIWKNTLSFILLAKEQSFKKTCERMQIEVKEKGLAAVIKEHLFKPTLIPLGVKVYMGEHEYLAVVPRSSLPLKKGLLVSNSPGIVDGDYVDNPDNEGLIYVQLINFLPFDVSIEKNEKLCQGIFHKFLLTDDDAETDKKTRVSGHGHTG